MKWIEIDQCIMCNPHRKSVLKEYDTIQHGIGTPDLYLALCLALAWIIIVSVLIKGVQSSGKASYFLGMYKHLCVVFGFGHCLMRNWNINYAWNWIKIPFCQWLAQQFNINFPRFSSIPVCHLVHFVDSCGNTSRCIQWHHVLHSTSMG